MSRNSIHAQAEHLARQTHTLLGRLQTLNIYLRGDEPAPAEAEASHYNLRDYLGVPGQNLERASVQLDLIEDAIGISTVPPAAGQTSCPQCPECPERPACDEDCEEELPQVHETARRARTVEEAHAHVDADLAQLAKNCHQAIDDGTEFAAIYRVNPRNVGKGEPPPDATPTGSWAPEDLLRRGYGCSQVEGRKEVVASCDYDQFVKDLDRLERLNRGAAAAEREANGAFASKPQRRRF